MIYFNIIKFNASVLGVYPFEFVSWVFQKITPLLFNILLWVIVLNSNPQINRSSKELASYYLIVAGISVITMTRYGKFGKALSENVKNGGLNTILLRPTNLLLTVYAASIGDSLIISFMGLIFLFFGLAIADITLFGIISFIIFIVISMIIAFGWNIIEAGLPALLINDFSGFRNVLNHVSSLFSGFLVPLYFFPDAIEKVIEYSPFPVLIYNPIKALSLTEFNFEVIQMLLLSIFWAIIINVIAIKAWKNGIKKYEAIGI